MKKTYVWNGEKVVPKEETVRAPSVAPTVLGDLPGYFSPCGKPNKPIWIEGRAARREDLKRHDCVELDPGQLSRWGLEDD